MCVYVHTYIYIYTHTCICRYIYIYIHTYTFFAKYADSAAAAVTKCTVRKCKEGRGPSEDAERGEEEEGAESHGPIHVADVQNCVASKIPSGDQPPSGG